MSRRLAKTCFLQMRDFRRIRQYLAPEVAVLAANALVSSRLDYCNSLFGGLSCFNQHKLQSIQDTLARIVTNHRKYAHVTPILKQLHWLPVKYQCIFKTGMNSLMMCAVQHQLPPSEKSSKLTCLQKPICHSLPCHPCVSLV